MTMIIGWLGGILLPQAVVVPTPTPAVLAQTASKYQTSFFHVYPDQSLSLIANFSQKADSSTLQQTHGCIAGINGGFYSESHTPIGWFVEDGKQINTSQKNSLFNGFLSRDLQGRAEIDNILPKTEVWSGVQTGPILFYKGEPVELQLVRDKQARRMVAAATSSGDLLFLSFYTDASSLDGPLLAELPGLITEFEQTHKFDIVAAVNLDGGSASTFFSEEIQLSEWQPIGSLWCVK